MADAPPETLREFTASRLPTYRHVDIVRSPSPSPSPRPGADPDQGNGPTVLPLDDALSPTDDSNSRTIIRSRPHPHSRTQSVHHITAPSPSLRDSNLTSPRIARNLTFPADFSTQPGTPRDSSNAAPIPQTPSAQKARRNPPAATARKDNNGPPLSMITQGYFGALSPTTDWVAQQSQSISSPTTANILNENPPLSTSAAKPSRPTSTLIKPIRGFKPSSRRQSSDGMASSRSSQDADNTIRASQHQRNAYSHGTNRPEQEEQNSDESDLFLRAAQEEEQLSRQPTITNGDSPSRSNSRRSRISRGSDTLFTNAFSRRRGSDIEATNESNPMAKQENLGQALTFHSNTRDRPSDLEELNKTRYYRENTRSTPNTPRGLSNREPSPPESQASYGGRRPSASDTSLAPSRSTYKASNLSYSTPRIYNSSPLVSRASDQQDGPETPRAIEGTESTVSTTAPSTVWDELDELKSRIHRLELTGKLPATSGAAITRASNDRPPTATTTVTTMSSSPKRGRANSASPIEQITVDPPTNEVHPLLQSALAKSKPLLSDEIYKALEATTSDALAISAMMGSLGQPGPISSSQSVVGGPVAGSVTDRQVRRKAESLCRSLTELCLALTEGKTDSQVTVRPNIQEAEAQTVLEPSNTQRQVQVTNSDLARVKASPRALSRLEARRSSLLATSTLPSPRYNLMEPGTPTQSSMAGRRTSLLLRGRRAATEEPEDNEFRTPSRAVTEVNQMRNSVREYTSQQPLPERQPSIQSSPPVRRHYTSTSLTNTTPTAMPPVSSLSGRRYLDRSTPERDMNSLPSRLDDRVQRKTSISQSLGLGRTGSLNRRTRQPSSADYSPAGQKGSY